MAKPNHAILIPIVAGYRQSVGKPRVVRRCLDVVLAGPGGGPGGSGYRAAIWLEIFPKVPACFQKFASKTPPVGMWDPICAVPARNVCTSHVHMKFYFSDPPYPKTLGDRYHARETSRSWRPTTPRYGTRLKYIKTKGIIRKDETRAGY